jgi:hypothetical protein
MMSICVRNWFQYENTHIIKDNAIFPVKFLKTQKGKQPTCTAACKCWDGVVPCRKEKKEEKSVTGYTVRC